jgi:hypothetical protein
MGRGVARHPRVGGGFVSESWNRLRVVLRRVHAWILKWVARELSGGLFSKR